jgi:membrane protein DedA with SNARE-associated domain
VSAFLQWLGALSGPGVYLVLGVGAGLENVIPAIPADTFVALGGLLSRAGSLSARWVFLWTWLFNVASALVVYRLSYRHGRGFFASGWGRKLLRPHQMERMSRFYDRWGTPAIFVTRFLPGIRSVVPIFAGVTLQGWLPVAAPIALASAIWYGALVWLGAWAGQNLDLLASLLSDVNRVLLVVAVVVAIPILVWWWRSRHLPDE